MRVIPKTTMTLINQHTVPYIRMSCQESYTTHQYTLPDPNLIPTVNCVTGHQTNIVTPNSGAEYGWKKEKPSSSIMHE